MIYIVFLNKRKAIINPPFCHSGKADRRSKALFSYIFLGLGTTLIQSLNCD